MLLLCAMICDIYCPPAPCVICVTWYAARRSGAGRDSALGLSLPRIETSHTLSGADNCHNVSPGCFLASSPVTLSDLPAAPLVYSPHILFSHRHRGLSWAWSRDKFESESHYCQ